MRAPRENGCAFSCFQETGRVLRADTLKFTSTIVVQPPTSGSGRRPGTRWAGTQSNFARQPLISFEGPRMCCSRPEPEVNPLNLIPLSAASSILNWLSTGPFQW
jgi:hypothetical protein